MPWLHISATTRSATRYTVVFWPQASSTIAYHFATMRKIVIRCLSFVPTTATNASCAKSYPRNATCGKSCSLNASCAKSCPRNATFAKSCPRNDVRRNGSTASSSSSHTSPFGSRTEAWTTAPATQSLPRRTSSPYCSRRGTAISASRGHRNTKRLCSTGT